MKERKMTVGRFVLLFVMLVVLAFLFALTFGWWNKTMTGTQTRSDQIESVDRESSIPSDAVKMSPETDAAPVRSLSDEYADPVPFSPLNTAGAEDSPFLAVDRDEFYLFFTPDVRVPVDKQVIDGVTGIYVSKKRGDAFDAWSEPERVLLQDKGKLSLDGCQFIQGDMIWFCAAREGYTGIHWFTAQYKDNRWQDWKNADFKPEYEVGELHFSRDGDTVYFHSSRAGGKGGLDLWMSKKADGEWQAPVNLEGVNSEFDEGWPALNPQEDELWISKNYGLWRSKLVDGEWQAPEEMFSPLAGEATLDREGNVYFTHHFFENGTRMIEADIYVAMKK